MVAEEVEPFSYAKNTDVYCLNPNVDLSNVVSIVAEHGIRQISTSLDSILDLTKAINKPIFGDKNIVPSCLIDWTNGTNSLDVRTYSINSAKEKGAKEVEVAVPYGLISREENSKIYEDAKNLVDTCDKYNVKFRYFINLGKVFTDKKIDQFAKVLVQCKIDSLVVYFDNNDQSENIIKMRNLKSKTNAAIKVWLPETSVEDIANFVKAGADGIGLGWQAAPNLISSYSHFIQKRE